MKILNKKKSFLQNSSLTDQQQRAAWRGKPRKDSRLLAELCKGTQLPEPESCTPG